MDSSPFSRTSYWSSNRRNIINNKEDTIEKDSFYQDNGYSWDYALVFKDEDAVESSDAKTTNAHPRDLHIEINYYDDHEAVKENVVHDHCMQIRKEKEIEEMGAIEEMGKMDIMKSAENKDDDVGNNNGQASRRKRKRKRKKKRKIEREAFLWTLLDLGLEYRLCPSVKEKLIFCKIRACNERLKVEAERIEFQLLLDQDVLKERLEQGNPDFGIDPVRLTDVLDQLEYSPYQYIYGKYTTLPQLQDVYTTYGWSPNKRTKLLFTSSHRIQLIESILSSNFDHGGRGPLNSKNSILLSHFPLHNVKEKKALQCKWIKFWSAPWNQPFDLIRHYFGEKIGLYFVWLGHYTAWLGIPAIGGLLATLDRMQENSYATNSVPIYCVVMAFWTTIYLEHWKRVNATVAMKWGTFNFEKQERHRSDFQGMTINSPIDGTPMVYFSSQKKLIRQCQSWLVVFILMVLVFFAVAGIFYLRWYTTQAHVDKQLTFLGYPLGPLLAATANALQILIMNKIYNVICMQLNDYENHKTDTQYENSLILKTFVFQFVNNYSCLFYIAFLKGFLFIEDQCKYNDCLLEMELQLAIVFGVRLLVSNQLELLLPRFWSWYREKQFARTTTTSTTTKKNSSFSPNSSSSLNSFISSNSSTSFSSFHESSPLLVDQKNKEQQEKVNVDGPEDPKSMSEEKDETPIESPVEKQFFMTTYEWIGTLEDYLEMVLQFGFCTLFVAAFPIAPTMAIINNYIEIRVDAYKLCHDARRSPPSVVEHIGVWYNILKFMSIAAIGTNGALIVFVSKCFHAYSRGAQVWIFFSFVIAVYFIKYLLEICIPDVPESVTIQLERQRFLRKTIIHRILKSVQLSTIRTQKSYSEHY